MPKIFDYALIIRAFSCLHETNMTQMEKDMLWNNPPVMTTANGDKRHVGFELEFTGIDLESIGNIICELYGGELETASPFQHKVVNTEFGDFILEVDSQQLKEKRYLDFINKLGITIDENEEQLLDNAMYDLSKIAVPFELVTPPIPIDRIPELSTLNEELFKMQAKGTRASFLYGFGMQFNPELPALDAETILNYLRSFFLLQPWLKEEINVDVTRRIMPFINNFDHEYIAKVLHPEYAPAIKQLIDDYLEYNPTRNRPLDMTCLFAYIDKERTFKKLNDSALVKPRPTFHYRLPDCRIDEKEWSIALEWNRWVKIEELAYNKKEIEKLSNKFLRENKNYLDRIFS